MQIGRKPEEPVVKVACRRGTAAARVRGARGLTKRICRKRMGRERAPAPHPERNVAATKLNENVQWARQPRPHQPA